MKIWGSFPLKVLFLLRNQKQRKSGLILGFGRFGSVAEVYGFSFFSPTVLFFQEVRKKKDTLKRRGKGGDKGERKIHKNRFP